MSQQTQLPPTQRAYTLRLRGTDFFDWSWRDALWHTHEAVNRGAYKFGDWLLTLRGGLDHSLANARGKGKSKDNQSVCELTNEERRTRRILLALSWLSVESMLGAPEQFIVATGQEAAKDRSAKVIKALEGILSKRGLEEKEIEEWKNDCAASLSADIRDDAVWVNRSEAFDEAVKRIGSSLHREEVWDMLERFFGSRNAYFAPAKNAESENESGKAQQEEKAKDLVQKAGQWLSSRFGTGKGANFSRMAKVYGKIVGWADMAPQNVNGSNAIASLAESLSEFTPAPNDLPDVLGLISGPGYKSATRELLKKIADKDNVTQADIEALRKKAASDVEKCNQNTGSKGQKAYSDAILNDVECACGFTYLQKGDSARHSEFAVMLDHAARRVSLAHTWIKRAEAERSKFEEDAKKINQIPKPAKDWLDQFCLERSGALGALEPYRIRRRAIDGWKEVVTAWSKKDCKTTEDRIAAARALQDDPEIDKFGDIQLFEALAADDAQCVWLKDDGTPNPQILIDYTLATEAQFKKRIFKVPAYRHPDPLLHPVFCDFGCSRWKIDFSMREAATKLSVVEAKLKKKQVAVQNAEQLLEKCRGQGERQNKAEERLREAQEELQKVQRELEYLRSPQLLKMTLFNSTELKEYVLGWQSKRLFKDLVVEKQASNDNSKKITRADRLGRAAGNASVDSPIEILHIFEEQEWNGRLQAPRQQLEALARYVKKHGWDSKAEKMRDNIKWLITFSARLQPQGPWCEYAREKNSFGLKDDPKFWPHTATNKTRKGLAQIILSRLPGLRVLSVDLGHRYAAACTVWESLSTEVFRKDIEGRKILCGGTDANALYCHTEHETNGKKHTTIYRRIGADTLPDGTPHPAPWARLDRQFLIKLQGELEGTREASNKEIWTVHQMEAAFGRAQPLIDRLVAAGWGNTEKQKSRLEALKNLGWVSVSQNEILGELDVEEQTNRYEPSLSVDELMLSAVRTLRLGLKRHSDRAKIAHYLITDEKTKPGSVKEKLDENTRIELLQNALVIWHNLFSSRAWNDGAAKKLWDEHIVKLSGHTTPDDISEDSPENKGTIKQKEKQKKLYDVAKALSQELAIRKFLYNAWRKRWEEDDEMWKKELRWFKDWVLPPAKILLVRKSSVVYSFSG